MRLALFCPGVTTTCSKKDLQVKLRDKKEMYRQWKQGWVAWEEYRDTVQMCRNAIRKAKE